MEILDTILNDAYIPISGVSALVAILCFSAYKHTVLRYFPVILLYTFLSESLATYLLGYPENTVLIYNIYNLIFFLFFFYVFWSFVQQKEYKRTIIFSVSVFLLTSIINPFFQNFMLVSQLYVYIVGGLLLIVCIILYFLELLYSPKVLNVKKDLLFWISVGLLLFYVGYIPIKLIRIYFVTGSEVLMSLRRVHLLLILIMHSCFIVGFLWTKKKLQD